jgi:4,5-dihydroxyphthalate decarboxylase
MTATPQKTRLGFACGLYDRMLALRTGDVKAEGIDLEFITMDSPRDIFDRMARGQEFQASELSMSEFIARKSANQCPFVAIPVFPSRSFRHGFVWINARSGIRTPKDLEGRRIGVPLYTMTAAVVIRGHLQNDFGVDLSGVQWVQGAINGPTAHGDPTVMPLLKPVAVEQNRSGKSLSDLLAEGKIDAIIGTSAPDSRRRDPDVRRLFPDFKAVEQDYYRRTRVFPIMHAVAIRKDVYERDPSVAKSLYEACCRSKSFAQERMRYLGALRYMLPWMAAEIDEIDEVFGGDPWPYGVEANRASIDAMIRFMVQQSMIAAPMKAEDVFVSVDSKLT